MITGSAPHVGGQSRTEKPMGLRHETALAQDSCFSGLLEQVSSELPRSWADDHAELPDAPCADDTGDYGMSCLPLFAMSAALPERGPGEEPADVPMSDEDNQDLLLADTTLLRQRAAFAARLPAVDTVFPLASESAASDSVEWQNSRILPAGAATSFLTDEEQRAVDQPARPEAAGIIPELLNDQCSEEHVAPKQPLGAATVHILETAPALQILSHISNERPQVVTAVAPQPGMNISHPAPAIPQSTELKTFRIRLHPEELGDVDVTLRRVGPETRVTITVARRSVAETLGRDLGFLEDKLGILFSSGTSQNVSVSLQTQEADWVPAQPPHSGPDQNRTEAALSGGYGTGRDSRPGTQDQHSHMNMRGQRRDENESLAQPSAGTGRVV